MVKVVWLQSLGVAQGSQFKFKYPAYEGQLPEYYQTAEVLYPIFSWVNELPNSNAVDYAINKGWAIPYDNWWTYPSRPAKVHYPYQ